MSRSTSVKLKDGLHERLKSLAISKNTTPNQLMNDAIIDYVERAEQHVAFLEEARERWDHYKLTGERIALDEADAWIDQLLAGEGRSIPTGKR